MPPRASINTGKARKSTGKPASSRTARKHLSQTSDEENTSSARKRGSTSDSKTDRDRSETASVAEQLVASKSSAGRGNRKSTTASPAKAPASGGKGRGGKGGKSLEALKKTAGRKRKATTTTTTEEEEDVDSDSEDRAEVTSGSKSRSGHSSAYAWDTEELVLNPADIESGKLKYHKQISTTVSRHNPDGEEVEFRRGDTIFVLPDSRTLPESSKDVDPEELDDSHYWVAEILDCCSLNQSSQGAKPLGLLRVRWFYNGDQAEKVAPWQEATKKKLRGWHWRDWEYIWSDHIDFIGLEVYAGHADISWRLAITGLKLDDIEIVKKPAKRAKTDPDKKTIAITGFSKTKPSQPGRVWMDNVKEYNELERKKLKDQRQKRKSGMSERAAAEEDDE